MLRIRKYILHICVICSLVCMTAKVLDWYNPYMDFSGHILPAQAVLYLGVTAAAFMGRQPRIPRIHRS